MNTKDTETPDLAKLAQCTGTAQYWRVARQFVDIQLRFAIFLAVAVGL